MIWNTIVSFIQQHSAIAGTVGVVSIWQLLAAVLNTAFYFKRPEDWIAWAEQNPRVAALDALLRSSGIDPVRVLLAFAQFANGKVNPKLSYGLTKGLSAQKPTGGDPSPTKTDSPPAN